MTARLLACATSLALGAGCQHEFAQPDAPADAGQPGPADAHTEPADAAQPECPPCDDGDLCNGEEQCMDGRCQPGQPPCLSSSHCDAACENHAGHASCLFSARDADHDGHGDGACAQVTPRGDDCDDSHATVYPGAKETCDGLDNDCNGRLDMEDGLPPIPPPHYFLAPGRSAQAAFTGTVYGLAYVRDGSVLFAAIDLSGAYLFENVPVQTLAQADDEHTRISVAADGERIAVAWSTPGELGMRFMGLDGQPDGPALDLRAAGQTKLGAVQLVQARPSHGGSAWLAAYGCCGSDAGLFARSVDALGKLSSVVQPLETLPVSGFALSSAGEHVMLTKLVDEDAQGVNAQLLVDLRAPSWAERTPGSVELEAAMPHGALYDPVMASSGASFAVAWGVHPADGQGEALFYAELDSAGAVLCRANLSERYPEGALPVRPLDMAFFGGAYVIAGAEQGTLSTALVQVRPGCRYAQRFRPYQDSLVRGTLSGQALASAGDKGGLLLWHTQAFPQVSLVRLGPNLCD